MAENVQLEYALPPAWPLRRKARRTLLIASLMVASLCCLWWRKPILHEANLQYWHWQCATWSPPAGQLMASTYAVDLQGLPASEFRMVTQAWGPLTARYEPDCYVQWCKLVGHPALNNKTVVFLHERRNSKGEARLVAMTWGGYMRAWTFRRQGTLGKWKTVGALCHTANMELEKVAQGKFRVCAGMADPADASHFSVPFDVDGQRGSIECWLKDDDRLRMKVQLPKNIPDGKFKAYP